MSIKVNLSILVILVILFTILNCQGARPNQIRGSCICGAPSLTMQCNGDETTTLTTEDLMVKTEGKNMRHHCNCDCPDMSCICPAAPSCPACPAAPDCVCNFPAPTDAGRGQVFRNEGVVVQNVETPYQGAGVSGMVVAHDTLFVVHVGHNMLYTIDLTDTTRYQALPVNGLGDPRGMVRMTPAGMTLVITDYGSASLHFLTLASSNNGWEIESQRDVALGYRPWLVSRDGDNLLVGDVNVNQIRVVNDEGDELEVINPQSTSYLYKAVPACPVPGLCYIVMDSNSKKLVLISHDGQEKAAYTGSPGQTNFDPRDIIVDDGSVYVADVSTARIQRLNLGLTWQGDVINLSDVYSNIYRLSLNEMTGLLYVSGLTKANKSQVSVIMFVG